MQRSKVERSRYAGCTEEDAPARESPRRDYKRGEKKNWVERNNLPITAIKGSIHKKDRQLHLLIQKNRKIRTSSSSLLSQRKISRASGSPSPPPLLGEACWCLKGRFLGAFGLATSQGKRCAMANTTSSATPGKKKRLLREPPMVATYDDAKGGKIITNIRGPTALGLRRQRGGEKRHTWSASP